MKNSTLRLKNISLLPDTHSALKAAGRIQMFVVKHLSPGVLTATLVSELGSKPDPNPGPHLSGSGMSTEQRQEGWDRGRSTSEIIRIYF